ncbi:MAG: YaaW family protein [Microcystaceae cyanobacterium]
MDELRTALELATEEELQQFTKILFSRKLNPIDYVNVPQPDEIQSRDWQSQIDAIEDRFRYLASDGLTVLKGKTQEFSYRKALIQVCQYLKIPYAQQMTTTDIEAEIFLHLIEKAWKKLPVADKKSITRKVKNALSQQSLPEPIPINLQNNPVNLILKGSSVIAVNSLLKSLILKQIARQFALHFTQYQMAKTTIVKGGGVLANQLAVKSAQRGMAMTAARYGAVRSVFAFVGPVLWGWFLADLGWRAITTNYGRIIPVIFTLAEIRLTRSECWEFA